MSTPDALSASDGGDAGSDIAACTAMLSRLTPSALRDDPALAPLLEADDMNAQSFACLALGNLAVEQPARSSILSQAYI